MGNFKFNIIFVLFLFLPCLINSIGIAEIWDIEKLQNYEDLKEIYTLINVQKGDLKSHLLEKTKKFIDYAINYEKQFLLDNTLFYNKPILEKDDNLFDCNIWDMFSDDSESSLDFLEKQLFDAAIKASKSETDTKNLEEDDDPESFDYIKKTFVKNSTKVIIIGDLHGNFEALDKILKDLMNRDTDNGDNGSQKILSESLELASNCMMIFLGDVIDRGPRSIENILTLMTLRLVNGENVILLRGNHEDIQTCSHYGFKDELAVKFNDKQYEQDYSLRKDCFFSMFNNYFNSLPSGYFLKNNEDIFMFNHAAWADIEFLDLFLDSEKKNLKITELEGIYLRSNDIFNANYSSTEIGSRGYHELKYSTATVFEKMKEFNIKLKFMGHLHALPKKENDIPENIYSDGFVCFCENDIPPNIYADSYDKELLISILISGSIFYPDNFIYKYNPTYQEFNVDDNSYYLNAFVQNDQDRFFEKIRII